MAIAGGTVYAASADKIQARGQGNHFTTEERTARQVEMETRRAAELVAINNNDYNAWKAAADEDCPFADKITAENFSQFIEARKEMEHGRAALESLDIEHQGRGMGRGMGMNR